MWGVGGEEAIESTIDTHPPPRLALYISAVFLSFAFARCFRTSLSQGVAGRDVVVGRGVGCDTAVTDTVV